jgi:hypothetical protein
MDARPEEDCVVCVSCGKRVDAEADDPAPAAGPSEAIIGKIMIKMRIDACRLSK